MTQMFVLEAPVDAKVDDILAFLERESQVIQPYNHLTGIPDGLDMTVNFHSERDSEREGNTISIYTRIFTTKPGKLYPRCYEDIGKGNEVIRFEIMRLTDTRSLIKGLYASDNLHIALMFYRRWVRLATAFGASFASDAQSKLDELEEQHGEESGWHESSSNMLGNKSKVFDPLPKQTEKEQVQKSPDVFISYSHKDKNYAHALATEFEQNLLMAWIDDRIDYGTQWPKVVQENLDACPIFVVIVSPNAYQSNWVHNELSYAQMKKKPIFPLLLNGEIWVSLAATQYADVRDGKMPSQTFFTSIKRAIESRTSSANSNMFMNKGRSDELMYPASDNLISKLSGQKPPEQNLPELSDEAKQLLIGVSLDPEGKLLAVVNESSGDLIIQTHGESLCNSNNPRIRAAWKDAVTQLESHKLIKSESKTKYLITTRGYQVADELKVISSHSSPARAETGHKEKPENEQIFKLTAREPLEKEPKEHRWASIDVENISSAILENCFVVLDDVLDMQGKSVLQIKRKRRLLWSWGDRETSRDSEKDIIPGEPKVVDVATTSPNNEQFTFETHAGQESKDNGVYEVIVTAHGRLNNQPKTETSNFILEYSGGNVLTIINKGNEKWSNPNPKKPERRNERFTDLKSPSS